MECALCCTTKKIMVHDYCNQCGGTPLCLGCYTSHRASKSGSSCPYCRTQFPMCVLDDDVAQEYISVSKCKETQHFKANRTHASLLHRGLAAVPPGCAAQDWLAQCLTMVNHRINSYWLMYPEEEPNIAVDANDMLQTMFGLP